MANDENLRKNLWQHQQQGTGGNNQQFYANQYQVCSETQEKFDKNNDLLNFTAYATATCWLCSSWSRYEFASDASG